MDLLIVAPPVAPLGDGRTGGVTLHITNTVKALGSRGHRADVLAPVGSQLEGARVIEVEGAPQPTLARPEDAGAYPIPTDGLIGALWHEAFARAPAWDLVLNFSHDWLPYFLTAFFDPPLRHIVNMSDVNEATSREIERAYDHHPRRLGFMTKAQAARFPSITDPQIISFGIDLSLYTSATRPSVPLAWAGRISREKGLEDALQIAADTGSPLVIAGSIDDDTYWAELNARFGDTIDHRGFLNTGELQSVLGSACAVLQTQRWHEAFGIVTVESLACGTPVIAYDKGANSELVVDGECGFLVPPGDIGAAAQAVKKISEIDRNACRERAASQFSLESYAAQLDRWLGEDATAEK